MLPRSTFRLHRQRGFTLIEMTISLFILVIVLVGVLALFDLASRISRVQVDVADMQESVRTGQYDMIRMLRMAGRGGAPASIPVRDATNPFTVADPPPPDTALPRGLAVSVANNTPADTFMDAGAGNSKRILEGTDVLTVRGSFTSPVWTVLDTSFTHDPVAGTGQLIVDYYPRANPEITNPSQRLQDSGLRIPQNLRPLAEAITRSNANGIPDALMLMSPLDGRFLHLVELDAANSLVTMGDPDGPGPEPVQPLSVRVAYRVSPPPATSSPAADYWRLSGDNWDAELTNVSTVALLEEYRYYILDDNREGAGTQADPPHPHLVRARVYPGSQVPYDNDPNNWDVAIADNIADLQVALGIEVDGPTPGCAAFPRPTQCFEPAEGPDTKTDEWLYNFADPDDSDTEAEDLPTASVANALKWANGRLYYVRVTTTAYAERRDREFRTPETAKDPVTLVPRSIVTEDHKYDIWDPSDAGSRPAKLLTPDQSYRRRSLRTVVDLRNLS
jgi:prepilin-type N-terminal cleavage/methylation domain-containing protein